MKTATLVLLSFPLLLIGLCLGSSWMVVDVHQADGPRLVVPVPMGLARALLRFAPEEARHVEIPELAEYSDVAEDIIDELLDAPDGVLVEVHDGVDHIRVEKLGDELAVDVDAEGETVNVRVPLTLMADILASYDGSELETLDVLTALSDVSSGKLAHIETEDDEITVWIW